MIAVIRARITTILGWPFRSPLAAPFWLGLRIYLGWVWLHFGLLKVRGGWITSNPMEEILTLIARGITPTPWDGYRRIAQVLLDLDLDRALSIAIPVTEIVLAAAFFAGVALVPAALIASALNVNLVLSGIATLSLDGRVIALQLLIVLGWRVAGYLGLGASLRSLGAQYRAAFRRHEGQPA